MQANTTLDDTSSSSSSDDDDSCADISVDIYQVPIMLVLGKWRYDNEIADDLAKELNPDMVEQAMHGIRAYSATPLSPHAALSAFMSHKSLGLAYLVLFRHRDKYYERHTGKKYSRCTETEIIPYFAHFNPRACCSNPSGITKSAIEYSLEHCTMMVFLGIGEGAFLKSAPKEMRSCGFEINADPLIMDSIRKNVLATSATFHFIPMSFSERGITLPTGDVTLFSWHPGSHRCPLSPNNHQNVTAFFAAVSFDNMEDTDLQLVMRKDRQYVYSTHPDTFAYDSHALQGFTVVDPEIDENYVELINSINLNEFYDKERAVSISVRKPTEARACAAWILFNVKWQFLRSHIRTHALSNSTRRLLESGIPQFECRRRILSKL